jgi:hypothetical protein
MGDGASIAADDLWAHEFPFTTHHDLFWDLEWTARTAKWPASSDYWPRQVEEVRDFEGHALWHHILCGLHPLPAGCRTLLALVRPFEVGCSNRCRSPGCCDGIFLSLNGRLAGSAAGIRDS